MTLNTYPRMFNQAYLWTCVCSHIYNRDQESNNYVLTPATKRFENVFGFSGCERTVLSSYIERESISIQEKSPISNQLDYGIYIYIYGIYKEEILQLLANNASVQ